MPVFENITEWTATVLDDPAYFRFHESIDITGARVRSYYKGRRYILMVRRCKRMIPYTMEKPYNFSNETHNESMINLRVTARLHHNYTQTCPIPDSNKLCSWYYHIWKKLYQLTNVWRGDVGPVKLPIPQ